jgi:hypothetical protein
VVEDLQLFRIGSHVKESGDILQKEVMSTVAEEAECKSPCSSKLLFGAFAASCKLFAMGFLYGIQQFEFDANHKIVDSYETITSQFLLGVTKSNIAEAREITETARTETMYDVRVSRQDRLNDGWILGLFTTGKLELNWIFGG